MGVGTEVTTSSRGTEEAIIVGVGVGITEEVGVTGPTQGVGEGIRETEGVAIIVVGGEEGRVLTEAGAVMIMQKAMRPNQGLNWTGARLGVRS